jgi:hypothetical protein
MMLSSGQQYFIAVSDGLMSSDLHHMFGSLLSVTDHGPLNASTRGMQL